MARRDTDTSLPSDKVGHKALFLAALENLSTQASPENRRWLLREKAKTLALEYTPQELAQKYRENLAAFGLSDKTLDLSWMFRATGKSLSKAGDAIGSSIRKIPASDWKKIGTTTLSVAVVGAALFGVGNVLGNAIQYSTLKNREEEREQLEFQNKVSQIILGDTVQCKVPGREENFVPPLWVSKENKTIRAWTDLNGVKPDTTKTTTEEPDIREQLAELNIKEINQSLRTALGNGTCSVITKSHAKSAGNKNFAQATTPAQRHKTAATNSLTAP